MFVAMQKIDDGIRRDILSQFQIKMIEQYKESGVILLQDSVFPIMTLRAGKDKIPAYLQQLNNGYYEFEEQNNHVIKGVVLSQTGDELHYYLIHNNKNSHAINNNLEQVLLSIIIIIFLISGIGVSIGLFLSRQIARPVHALQQQIRATDPNNLVLSTLNRTDEFGEISAAYNETLKRIKQAIEREKRFSMYASHELRTPVSIIKSSINLWQRCEEVENQIHAEALKRKAVNRVAVASDLMEEVIQTFLLLSKRSLQRSEFEAINMKQLLNQTLEKYQGIEGYQQIEVVTESNRSFMLHTNRLATFVIFSTLLRNSFEYCANRISIELSEKQLQITNDINQIKIDNTEHFGFGLEIVYQLCEQLQWEAQVLQVKDNLFIVTITFSESDVTLL